MSKTLDTNGKSIESSDKIKERKNNQKSKFIKEFIVENSDDKNSFLNNIMDGTSLSNELKNSINLKLSNYPDLSLDDISINDFKNKLLEKYIPLKNRRDNLKKQILNTYEIEDKEYDNKISQEVKKIDIHTINKFLKNTHNFLLNIYDENNLPKTKNFSSFLSKIKFKNKFDSLTEKQKKSYNNFYKFNASRNNIGKIKEIDFIELFNSGAFTQKEKIEIINSFFPQISISQALKIGIISEEESKERKKTFLKKVLVSKGLIENSETEKDKASDFLNNTNIKNEDIYLDTKLLFTESSLSGYPSLYEKYFKSFSENIDFENFIFNYNNEIETINETINETGPQTLEKLKTFLLSKGVGNIGELKEGGIIKISTKRKDVFLEEYFKITSFDDDQKTLGLLLVGENNDKNIKTQINSAGTEKVDIKYNLFLSFFVLSDDIKYGFNLLSKDQFKDIIKDENSFEINNKQFESVRLEEFLEDSEFSNDIRKDIEKQYILDLENLEEQINELEQETESLEKNDKNKSRLENIKTKRVLLEKLKNDKKDDIENISSIETEELVNHKRYSDLVSQIDSLDSSGKQLGIRKGIIIEVDGGKNQGNVYEITDVDKEKGIIELLSYRNEPEFLSYEAFFQAFSKKKAKRIEKIENPEQLIEKNEWNGFKIKNGELIEENVEYTDEKGNSKKEDKKIEYLVGEKGQLIKIESFSSGEIEVYYGKLVTKEEKSDEKNKKGKSTTHNISLNKDPDKITLNHLQKIINFGKYKPDWKIGQTYKTGSSSGYTNDITGGFMGRLWNGKSLTELYMGGKGLIDGITEYLGKGNEIKAAEFGLSISKFLPQEIHEDYKTQIENKQNEAMDKELTALGKIGSGPATNRILKWIKNTNTPEYKKEAGLMYLAKYGQLYSKGLRTYEGTFLWYEALGGSIGDEMYEKYKDNAKTSNDPFNEIDLIIGLLGAQSGGHKKPNRRSKFNKEFKGKINGGYKEEFEDGYKDGGTKRGIKEIINGGKSEGEGNTLSNLLGWAKASVEKGGSLKEMNELYFMLVYSGSLYTARTDILEELKNQWNNGNSMLFAGMSSTLGGQKILNKTILDVSKDIEKIEGKKYIGISKKAQEIYDLANDTGSNFNDRMEKTSAFWNDYGEVLSRTLYMADDDKTEFAKTDKIIVFGKESKYKPYTDLAHGWTHDNKNSFGKDFLSDEVGTSGMSGIDNYTIIEKFFGIDSGGTFSHGNVGVIDTIWPIIWKDIISTKDKVNKTPENKENYKKYLNNKLRQIVGGLMKSSAFDRRKFVDKTDPTGKDLQSIGIKVTSLGDVTVKDVLNGNIGKDIFDNAVERVLSGDISSISSIGGLSNKSSTFDLVDEYKGKVDNNLQ